jgi:hypothetical protein
MQVPIKFNFLSGNWELGTKQTLKTTINSYLEKVQSAPTELNHDIPIEGTNLS